MNSSDRRAGLEMMLRSFRLPSFVKYSQEVAMTAEKGGWSFEQFLYHLCELEAEDRRVRRIERFLKASKLPQTKTLATLETKKLPTTVQRQLPVLCEGGFAERAVNVLAFGLPGRGKSHLVCAIGHELIQRGYRVLFTPTFQLVQNLLFAKRELVLDKLMKRLDRFDVVILDDIGYVQQNREEMEVLFMFLAERYERRSVMITSNLVFSQWDKIFKDPMTTACAIDRVVHHSVILELNGPSYRAETAKKRTEAGDGLESPN
jgi:DNA replication protein DnaC